MSSSLLRPDKHLRFSEDHFQGYWIQLVSVSLIHRNDDADELFDEIIEDPIAELCVRSHSADIRISVPANAIIAGITQQSGP